MTEAEDSDVLVVTEEFLVTPTSKETAAFKCGHVYVVEFGVNFYGR